MRTLRAWLIRLGSRLRWQARERDMQAELESHLDLHIDHNRRMGMTPDEARRRALLALGGVEQAKERYRDRAGIPAFEIVLRDLRDAGRRLRRAPGPVLVILVTLAAALGTNSAVFAITDALVLRPFSLPDIDRLVVVSERGPDGGQSWTSPATFLDWRQRSSSFHPLSAVELDYVELGDRDPERLQAAKVSHDFFDIVGRPARGRGFLEEEATLGRQRSVILGDGLWQRRFAADPAVVGRTVVIDGIPHLVVGIAPPQFAFPYGAEVWLPLAFSAEDLASRDHRVLFGIGRLADGASRESADLEMSAIASSIARQFPATHKDRGAMVQTLVDGFIEWGLRPLIVLLDTSALLVLFIACANIANLLVALAVERRREVAVRCALGATRGAIVRGVWLEHLTLALLAAPFALAIAGVALRLLRASMPPRLAAVVPGFEMLDIDGRLVIFTLALAFVSAGVFGAFAATQASRQDLDALKEGARTQTAGLNRLRLRRILVVAQVAFVLPLIVTAASSVRGTLRLLNGPQGYDPEGVVTVRLTLPERQYTDGPSKERFVSEMLEGLRRNHVARDAAVVSVLPSTNLNQRSLAVDVQARSTPPGEPDYVDYRVVSPGYFDTMRIRILRGRAFTEADLDNAAPVAIVSTSMAEKYWPGSDPIGRGVRDAKASAAPWASVIGVVDDVVHDWYVGGNTATLYRPYQQDPPRDFALAVRTRESAAALLHVAAVIHALDPARPLNDVMPMREVIQERLTAPRQVAHIMAAVGGLALLLATMGLYGIVGYSVSQRTHEIGLRVALGASRRDVLRLVVGQASGLTLIGLAIGAVLTLGTTGMARAVTFGIAPFDARWLVAMALFVAAIGLAAAYAPARRALAIPPVIALRDE